MAVKKIIPPLKRLCRRMVVSNVNCVRITYIYMMWVPKVIKKSTLGTHIISMVMKKMIPWWNSLIEETKERKMIINWERE